MTASNAIAIGLTTKVIPAGTIVWGFWSVTVVTPTPDALRAAMAPFGEPFATSAGFGNVGVKLGQDMTELELHKAFSDACGGNAARLYAVQTDLLEELYEGAIAWDEFSGDVGDIGKQASETPGAVKTGLKWFSIIAIGVGIGLVTQGVILWVGMSRKAKK
jgi:hypothetical protein